MNEKPNRDGRPLKILLDGKCPITEAGDPARAGNLNVIAERIMARIADIMEARMPHDVLMMVDDV